MVKPTGCPPDIPADPSEEAPPRAHVHTATIGAPEVRLAIHPIQIKLQSLLGPKDRSESTRFPTIDLKPKCHRMRLFDPQSMKSRQLAIWRHHRAHMISPPLVMQTIQTRSLPTSAPLVHLKPGWVRPLRLQLRTLPRLPSAKVATLTCNTHNHQWHLLVYALTRFRAKHRAYYHWYARDRLNLDLDDPSFVGLCCPLPPINLNPIELIPNSEHQVWLLVNLEGHAQEDLEGRHAFVFRSNEGPLLARLPPPNN